MRGMSIGKFGYLLSKLLSVPALFKGLNCLKLVLQSLLDDS